MFAAREMDLAGICSDYLCLPIRGLLLSKTRGSRRYSARRTTVEAVPGPVVVRGP